MTRRSKYYAAYESWTQSPAWAFEIPLRQLENRLADTIVLRYEKHYRSGDFAELCIPSQYLISHLGVLRFRADRGNISLFLSARATDRLTDLRGSGRVSFADFERQ